MTRVRVAVALLIAGAFITTVGAYMNANGLIGGMSGALSFGVGVGLMLLAFAVIINPDEPQD